MHIWCATLAVLSSVQTVEEHALGSLDRHAGAKIMIIIDKGLDVQMLTGADFFA